VIEEQRSSSSVSTVLGSEQISRNGDSDVASALRRASGLTIIGGKFVFIRGLGERYSTTLINGSAIPSPDPTRRVVPLDLFPTTFIDSILVQKSYSVDRPGEFAGGTLDMRTKRVPDEFFVKFGA
jgi:outer membrane receptor for ferrienterochelin and colicin